MNDKIFAILEFEKIREMLGKWATSQPGLDLCRNLMPETDIEIVQRLPGNPGRREGSSGRPV